MHFPVLLVLSAALSAVASPHHARAPSHHAIAQRAAIPEAAPQPVVVPQPKKVRKRGDSSRCRTRSSSPAPAATTTHVSSSSVPHTTSSPTSSPSPTPSSIVPPKNVGADPTEEPSTDTPAPTTTKAPEPTTTKAAAPTTTKAPEPTTTKAASPTPTTTAASSGNDPLGILTGTHSGDGTFYNTGLTACGITNTDSELIAAVSHELFDNFPGYQGGNPNNNPLCKRKIRATYQGNSVDVQITDRCVGCAMFDVDFSPAAFEKLASFDLGRIHGVEWHWL
ncbi:RlpA-like double-psi beta-barrel-protein domain-containing protein-containing protein [Daedaleopsis nitida]|nr:RlpA-like double-psi beta-barrel-protein domain-containing protein-containing protein [Daedaleopsis nitida]